MTAGRSGWGQWGHEHQSIIRGMLLVGSFAVLGKLASAAKEIAVAWRYGVSAEVDAYLERQVGFDSDIWIVAVEDRAGRHFLDEWLAPPEPGPSR